MFVIVCLVVCLCVVVVCSGVMSLLVVVCLWLVRLWLCVARYCGCVLLRSSSAHCALALAVEVRGQGREGDYL